MDRPQKKRLKVLTNDKKKAIIAEKKEGNLKNKELAEKYGIKESTMSKLWKNREKYEKMNKVHKKSKKIVQLKYREVECAVIYAFEQWRDHNIPVTGLMLKNKAKKFAELMGICSFKASEGWLDKFKKRNSINCKKLSGEAASVSEEVVVDWMRDELPGIIQHYSLEDIYNFDETGLFFRCTPDKTLDYKGKACHDGKKSKERLTVGLGVNCTGTDKLEPIVIGKYKQPRCFKHVKSLPVMYEANRTAWMTGEICLKYFKKLNERLALEGRKILMMMDSCPAHPKVELDKLQYIEFKYFPKNCTSRLQPLDLGIIKNAKLHYKNQLVGKIVDHLDEFENLEEYKEPTVLDAILSLNNVWFNLVKEETIKNCFAKAGFKRLENHRGEIENGRNSIDIEMIENDAVMDSPSPITTEDEFTDLGTNLNKIQKTVDFDIQDFLNADDNLATSGMLSDEQILQEIESRDQATCDTDTNVLIPDQQTDNLSEFNSSLVTAPTKTQIKQACDVLEKVALTQTNVSSDIFQCIQKLQNFAKMNM